MNLRSLGATLATLVKDNQDQTRIFTDAVNKVQEVLDSIESASKEVIEGYQAAGGTWIEDSATVDENEEDLTYRAEYIAANHPHAAVRSWASNVLDTHRDLSFLEGFINKWYVEATKHVEDTARALFNPNNW